MALFNVAPAGSGILTPIWPNLTFRFSTDGLGLVFEDSSSGFLLVWNADYLPRAIEYSPGLFTPVLVEHTAYHVDGQLSGWLGAGPPTWSFQSYPAALGYDFEIDRHVTDKSSYGFPTKYTGSSAPSWDRDSDWNTHQTGGGRRFLTWPPLRGMRYHPDPTKQADAWTASLGWCMDQLRRPWAHISDPNTPFKGIKDYDNFTINQADTNRLWTMNHKVKVKDRAGTLKDINNFDPAHGVSLPPFALACAGHPLGVVLLWLHAIQFVQGVPPSLINSFGSYSFPFDQERSVAWQLELYKHCVLVGFDYMDPDLKRDWWGGLRPGAKGNNGLGWTPREALRWALEVFAGPDYGGPSSANSRYIERTEDSADDGFDTDGHHQPYMNVGTRYDYNGKHYRREFPSEKAFHRYLCTHAVDQVLRAHDFLYALDATDPLLDLARLSELRRFHDDYCGYVVDTGYIADADGTLRGHWRQRTHVFQHATTEKGFESFAAIDGAVLLAISHDPFCPYPSSNPPPWVYPGTDSTKMEHLFVRQHTARYAPGAGLWHLVGGLPISSSGGSDTEAHLTGIPCYADVYGYDANLAAMFTSYSSEIGSLSDTSAISHYESFWRAKERYDSSGSRNPSPGTMVGAATLGGYQLTSVEIKVQLAPAFAVGASVPPTLGGSGVVRTPASATAVASSDLVGYVSNLATALQFRPAPAFATGASRAPLDQYDDVTVTPAAATAVVAVANNHAIDPGSGIRRYTPERAFASTASVRGSNVLGSVARTPASATAVFEVLGPVVIQDPGVQRRRPPAATMVAGAVDPGYIVVGNSVNKRPPPSFAVARTVAGTTSLGSVAATPVAATAGTQADLGQYDLSTISPGSLRPAPTTAVAASVDPTVVLGGISRTPAVADAVAAGVDGTLSYRYGDVLRQPSPAHAIAARAVPGYVLSGARVPEHVLEEFVEVPRERTRVEVRRP